MIWESTPRNRTTGALILTYTILGAFQYKYSKYNGPQSPILIIMAPKLALNPYRTS